MPAYWRTTETASLYQQDDGHVINCQLPIITRQTASSKYHQTNTLTQTPSKNHLTSKHPHPNCITQTASPKPYHPTVWVMFRFEPSSKHTHANNSIETLSSIHNPSDPGPLSGSAVLPLKVYINNE